MEPDGEERSAYDRGKWHTSSAVVFEACVIRADRQVEFLTRPARDDIVVGSGELAEVDARLGGHDLLGRRGTMRGWYRGESGNQVRHSVTAHVLRLGGNETEAVGVDEVPVEPGSLPTEKFEAVQLPKTDDVLALDTVDSISINVQGLVEVIERPPLDQLGKRRGEYLRIEHRCPGDAGERGARVAGGR